MARVRQEIRVDNQIYSVCPLPPTQASLLFVDLVKTFGPVIGKMYKGVGDVSVTQLREDANIVKNMPIEDIILTVADRIEPEKIVDMARKLLAETYPKDKPMMCLGSEKMFDAWFDTVPGGIFHIGKLLKEVLQLQYADLFTGLGIQEDTQTNPPDSPTEYPMVP